MTEYGFGLFDRRTVLAVLFTFSVSHLLFGNQFPVDSGDVLSILFGIIMITGSIFILRTLSRIVIAIVYFLLRVPFDAFNSLLAPEDDGLEGDSLRGRVGRILSRTILAITNGVGKAFVEGFLVPLVSERKWRLHISRFDLGYRGRVLYMLGRESELSVDLGVLGMVDRIALVLIAFFLTLPVAEPMLSLAGFAGIILLLIIFVVTGKFTFVLKDPFQDEEERQDQLLDITMRSEETHR